MAYSTGKRRGERLPSWLRRKIPVLAESARIEGVVRRAGLHTICREGLCPNRAECYARGRVTFMLLGDICTRRCGFCGVAKGIALPPDPGEPERIASAAARLGLRHVVVTSVTRDDLPDGGAAWFAATARRLRALDPSPAVEVLVPDFGGSARALDLVLDPPPEIFSHNVETVRRLYPAMRAGADYGRSLALLRNARRLAPGIRTKSALMLGLGEKSGEVWETLADLRDAGVDCLALGQYLRPRLAQEPVREYLPPAAFEELAQRARRMGFSSVAAGPLVRSSYGGGDDLELDRLRPAGVHAHSMREDVR